MEYVDGQDWWQGWKGCHYGVISEGFRFVEKKYSRSGRLRGTEKKGLRVSSLVVGGEGHKGQPCAACGWFDVSRLSEEYFPHRKIQSGDWFCWEILPIILKQDFFRILLGKSENRNPPIRSRRGLCAALESGLRWIFRMVGADASVKCY